MGSGSCYYQGDDGFSSGLGRGGGGGDVKGEEMEGRVLTKNVLLRWKLFLVELFEHNILSIVMGVCSKHSGCWKTQDHTSSPPTSPTPPLCPSLLSPFTRILPSLIFPYILFYCSSAHCISFWCSPPPSSVFLYSYFPLSLVPVFFMHLPSPLFLYPTLLSLLCSFCLFFLLLFLFLLKYFFLPSLPSLLYCWLTLRVIVLG